MRTFIALMLSLLIAGCGMTSGTYVKKPIIKADNTVATHPRSGRVLYSVERKAGPVAIMESVGWAKDAIKPKEPAKSDSPPAIMCQTMTPDQISNLSATGQVEYFRTLSGCQNTALMAAAINNTHKIVDSALNRPISDVDAITRNLVGVVKAAEDGKTERVEAVANPLSATLKIKAVAKSAERVGVAAAKTGNTTVGNITSSASRSTAGGAHGEGEGFAAPEGGPSNSQIIIGHGNRTATAFDNGRAVNGINQDLQESANGNIADGNQEGVVNADENEGDANDNDGGNSLL